MTDYCTIAKSGTGEFGMHAHQFPDGTVSTAHSHAYGDVHHQHIIKSVNGYWCMDYANDPMLSGNTVAMQQAPIAQGQLAPVQTPHTHSFQPDPPMQMPRPKVAINQSNPNWPVGFKVYFDPGSMLPPGFAWEDDLVYGSPAPEPKKSRADLIWEAIQGASKA